MSEDPTPTCEGVPFWLDYPKWEEPNLALVSRLAAMRSCLHWARLCGEWLHQVQVAAFSDPVVARRVPGAVSSFNHTIEIILARWRCWFPDDAPPDLPEKVRWGLPDAHRVVDKAQRHLEEMEQRGEALVDRVQAAIAQIPADPWEFRHGQFRYQAGVWHNLPPVSWKLLRAFVGARGQTLTHDKIGEACTDGHSHDRIYAYVSELNKALRKALNATANPIKPIPRQKAYCLTYAK